MIKRLSRNSRLLISLLLAAAGSMGLVSPALVPDEQPIEGTWRGVQDSEACRLEFLSPDQQILISFAQFADSYSIGGILLAPVDLGQGQAPEIAMIVGGKRIIFWGPEELLRKTGQDQPIAELRESVEGQNTLVLLADRNRTVLPLTAMEDAKTAMAECVAEPALAKAAARDPRLISFEGMQELAQEASRQRMLSQELGYTITVDPSGKPIDCDLSRKFRRKATEIALCRPMLKSMTFEPARDVNGTAIEGTYSSTIYFDMWMTQRGYLESEDR